MTVKYEKKTHHHRLHHADLLPIIATVPARRLQRHVVQVKILHAALNRLLTQLDIVMPERIVALLQNLARRLEMAGRIGSDPEVRRIAAGAVSDGQPLVHGVCRRLPGEAGTETERVDDGNRLPRMRVLGEQVCEPGCLIAARRTAADGEIEMRDAYKRETVR